MNSRTPSDNFQKYIQEVYPVLSETRRTEPVTHAGIAGVSYHGLVCSIALRQYGALWVIASPKTYVDWLPQTCDGVTGDEVDIETVVERWDRIADLLQKEFTEPINAELLMAGIATDPAPKTGGHGPGRRSSKKVAARREKVGKYLAENMDPGEIAAKLGERADLIRKDIERLKS